MPKKVKRKGRNPLPNLHDFKFLLALAIMSTGGFDFYLPVVFLECRITVEVPPADITILPIIASFATTQVRPRSLPETNELHLKIGLPNRQVVFPASIFRGYVSFREGMHVKVLHKSLNVEWQL